MVRGETQRTQLQTFSLRFKNTILPYKPQDSAARLKQFDFYQKAILILHKI